MQILITGGTGYVGRYVVEKLSGGHRVFVISRKKPSSYGRATYIQCDITNIKELVKKTEGLKFDSVIHLAAYHPKNPFESLEKSIKTNVLGTLCLINYCERKKINHLIFSSTFTVYGQGSNRPIAEDFMPKPINPYALSKYFCEKLLAYFAKDTGANVIILRISGIFGGDRRDGAIYNFVTAALANNKITVSNPFNYTDMVYVDDVISVIKKSLERQGFEVFNISSGEKYAVLELAKLIREKTKSNSPIEIKPPDVHEALQLHLNIKKAKSLLDFSPTSLEEGISKVIRSLT